MGLRNFTTEEVTEKKEKVEEPSFKNGKLGTEVKELYKIIEDLTARVEVLEGK